MTPAPTPKLDPARKLDPAYVATLRALLDMAVEQIAVQNRTPATKAMMAQIIVRHAAEGMTDTRALLSQAVQAGAEAAP